jgi:demethylmenaquinone methyltransferase/2-methoxy-6-polyprenyl-1,4-benzoquinol methylase
VLLIQRNQEPNRGSWTIPSGYVEKDEPPDAAVVREVYEETGLRVRVTGLVAICHTPKPWHHTIWYIFGVELAGPLSDLCAEGEGEEIQRAGFFTLEEFATFKKVGPLSLWAAEHYRPDQPGLVRTYAELQVMERLENKTTIMFGPPGPPLAHSRVLTTRRETRRTYDRLSGIYDWLGGAAERRLRAVGLQRLDVQPGERVLEVGCGTGADLPRLAQAVGPQGLALGLDLSSGMLAVARRRLERASPDGSGRLLCGDAAYLPLGASSLDALWMSFTLELFDTPEIPRLLAECRRVLKPGGRLAAVALSAAGPESRLRRWYEWSHAHFPQWVDCRPINAQAALTVAGFKLAAAEQRRLWGLPVEVVLGVKV